MLLQDAVVDEGAQDQGVDRTDGGVEDHHREEDGQDLAVGDGEGEHPPGRALLDPVLQDGAVLAHGAHARPSHRAATHGVPAHAHGAQPTGGASLSCQGDRAGRVRNGRVRSGWVRRSPRWRGRRRRRGGSRRSSWGGGR